MKAQLSQKEPGSRQRRGKEIPPQFGPASNDSDEMPARPPQAVSLEMVPITSDNQPYLDPLFHSSRRNTIPAGTENRFHNVSVPRMIGSHAGSALGRHVLPCDPVATR